MNVVTQVFLQARRTPGAAALISPRATVTFEQLERLVRSGAKWLNLRGIRPGDVVGMTLANPIENVIVSLSLGWIGAVQVNVAPGSPPQQQSRIAKRTGMVCHITSAGQPSQIEIPNVPIDFSEIARRSTEGDDHADALGPTAPFTLVPGSGTTGEPKIVALGHDMVHQRLLQSPQSFMRPGDRALSLIQVQFYTGKQQVLAGLIRGAASVFVPPNEMTEGLTAIARRFKVSYAQGTPVHLHEWLDKVRDGDGIAEDLRLLRIGGTRVDAQLRQRVSEKITPNVAVTYGAIEVSFIAVAPPPVAISHPHSVGYPLADVDLQIVDADDQVLPAGQAGEIRIKSPWMARSYWGDEAASARSFRDGWFYPGDLGEFTAGGLLIHHGRMDDMMLYDGINIFPLEIERVLQEHPAVLEVAAFPIASGRHQDVPAAAITIRSPIDLEELARFARERLGVKAPKALTIVSALPRNPAGKILKSQLAADFVREGSDLDCNKGKVS